MSIQELSTDQENAVEMITCVIDGFEITVPKGTLVIRAAEKLGIQIPRFCDHPLLEPAGSQAIAHSQAIARPQPGHSHSQAIAIAKPWL